MKLQVQSIHFDADEKLLGYIQQKCDKLDTFYDRITDGQVYLKLEKHSSGASEKIVEIKVNVPSEILMAKEKGRKFEEGVDLAVDKIKGQLRKYKEKQKKHHARKGAPGPDTEESIEDML